MISNVSFCFREDRTASFELSLLSCATNIVPAGVNQRVNTRSVHPLFIFLSFAFVSKDLNCVQIILKTTVQRDDDNHLNIVWAFTGSEEDFLVSANHQ